MGRVEDSPTAQRLSKRQRGIGVCGKVGRFGAIKRNDFFDRRNIMNNEWGVRKFFALLGIGFCLMQGLWAQSGNVSVFASGFNNPRGLKLT